MTGRKPKTALEPRAYLLFLLARRDYPRSVLEKKLRAREVSQADIEKMLNEFIDAGLYREEAFARSRTRVLAVRGVAARRIRADLKGQRVVPEEGVVEQTLEEMGLPPETQVRALVEKAGRRLGRRERIQSSDKYELRRKLVQAAMVKGHDYSLARRIVDEYLSGRAAPEI